MCSSARCNVLKERNINSRAEPPQMCRPHWFSYPVRERAPFMQQHTRLCQKKSVRKIDFVGICEKSNSCFRSSSHLALLLSLCKYDYCKIKRTCDARLRSTFATFPSLNFFSISDLSPSHYFNPRSPSIVIGRHRKNLSISLHALSIGCTRFEEQRQHETSPRSLSSIHTPEV